MRLRLPELTWRPAVWTKGDLVALKVGLAVAAAMRGLDYASSARGAVGAIETAMPLAAWAGIMMADIALRRKDYDEHGLFNSSGRYGAVNWVALGIMAVCCAVGWGFVVNGFAEEAAWNNWQGYLLFLLGGRDGVWAGGNIGVIISLIVGFAGYYALCGARVRRQESPAG